MDEIPGMEESPPALRDWLARVNSIDTSESEMDGFDMMIEQLGNEDDSKDSPKTKKSDIQSTMPTPSDTEAINSSGERVDIGVYLGHADHQARIDGLHNVKPLDTPDCFKVEFRPWQLKGAASIEWARTHDYRGVILADPPGLGKIWTTIRALYESRLTLGRTLIITPFSLIMKWLPAFDIMFKEGQELSVYWVKDPKLSGEELVRRPERIFICTLQFVERNGRTLRQWLRKRDRGELGNKDPEKPPFGPLHCDYWRRKGLPWKMVVIDECQMISDVNSSAYKGIEMLYRAATMGLLEDISCVKKWSGLCGMLSLLRNHPVISPADFKRLFGEGRDNTAQSYDRMLLLQQLLKAMIIANPSSVLDLPEVEIYMVYLESIRAETVLRSNKYFAKFKRATAMTGGEENLALNILAKKQSRELQCAIKAEQVAMHTMLLASPDAPNESEPESDVDDISTGKRKKLKSHKKNKKIVTPQEMIINTRQSRRKWLQSLATLTPEECSSDYVVGILSVFEDLHEVYPGEKVALFSRFVSFLDILAKAYSLRFGKDPFRCDESMTSHEQEGILNQFTASKNWKVPIFFSFEAAGDGSAVIAASGVILCEPSWNINIQKQAILRCHGISQPRTVKAVLIAGDGIKIDAYKLKVSSANNINIPELMRPIVKPCFSDSDEEDDDAMYGDGKMDVDTLEVDDDWESDEDNYGVYDPNDPWLVNDGSETSGSEAEDNSNIDEDLESEPGAGSGSGADDDALKPLKKRRRRS